MRMNALLPAEPFDEKATPVTAIDARPPAVEVLSAEKVFANGTLLKLIANLIEPSDGRLLWWRGDFAQVGQAGRRLAFVFQEPTLMPWARVEANVRLPLEFANMPRATAD